METKMLQVDLLELDRECQVFGRFLINKIPDAYVLEKYRSAHRAARNVNSGKLTEFDRILLRIGTLQPWTTRIVDSYCRVFFPASSVRRKCILLLAILECSPTAYAIFETPDMQSKGMTWVRIVADGLIFVGGLLLGITVLMPLQLIIGMASYSKSR